MGVIVLDRIVYRALRGSLLIFQVWQVGRILGGAGSGGNSGEGNGVRAQSLI